MLLRPGYDFRTSVTQKIQSEKGGNGTKLNALFFDSGVGVGAH